MTTPAESISAAIRQAHDAGRTALVAFVTAGFPTREGFAAGLLAIADAADVVEIGVPFTDPMADGMTIQRASRAALAQGVSLQWILDTVASLPRRPTAPLLLMSYLNPLLAYGLDRLPAAARAAGISGFIVPDLPHEEAAELESALAREGLALIQMVTPVTPAARLESLCSAAQGFVYAVTMTGYHREERRGTRGSDHLSRPRPGRVQGTGLCRFRHPRQGAGGTPVGPCGRRGRGQRTGRGAGARRGPAGFPREPALSPLRGWRRQLRRRHQRSISMKVKEADQVTSRKPVRASVPTMKRIGPWGIMSPSPRVV